MATTNEFTRGKTILALAVVVGCFAILWPKIFYPSLEGLAGSNSGPAPKDERVIKKNPKKDVCCGVIFDESDVSQQILAQVCSSVLSSYHKDVGSPDSDQEKTTHSRSALALEHGGKLPDKIATQCRQQVQQKCGQDITWLLARLSKPLSKAPVPAGKPQRPSPEELLAQNLTLCLQQHFNVDPALLSRSHRTHYAGHPLFTPRHMRPERPTYLHPEMMHPALREKGRAIPPMRTIDRQAKPGPVPGMRPPMGGGSHVVTPGKAGGGGGGYGGTMGIIMPIYTIGIIVFFVYTISKVMFRSKEPAPVDNFTSGLQAFKDFPLTDPVLQRQFLNPETRSSPPRAPKPEAVPVPEEELREKSLIPEPVIDLTVIPQVPPCTHAAATTAPREATPPVVTTVSDTSVPPQDINSDAATNQQEPDLRLHLDIQAQKDLEMDQLRRRLEETEKAMARIMAYMGTVSDKLAPTVVAEVMAQAEKVRQGKEALLSGQASLETENEVMDQTKAFMTLLQEAGVDADLSLSSEIMPEIPSSLANNSTPTEPVPEIINTFSQNTAESLLQEVLAPSHQLTELIDMQAPLHEPAVNIQAQEHTPIEQEPTEEPTESAHQDAEDLLEVEEQIIPESVEKRTGLQELQSEPKPILEELNTALDLTDIESQILSETLNLAQDVKPTVVDAKPAPEAEPTQTEAPQATQPASVAVMNMEVSVALENKAKMSRSPTPVKDLLPRHKHDSGDLVVTSPESSHSVADSGPQDVSLVFLEAVLPAESQLLVSEAECRAEAVPLEQLDLSESEYETAPVVLSGKMTLSVIGMELPPAGGNLEATEIEEMPTDHVTAPWEEEDKTEMDAPVIAEPDDAHEAGSPTRIHRVRFQPEPEQVIIPANDDEYYYGEDADETQDSSACAAEAADNTLSDFDAENLDEELLLMGASGVELSSSPSSVQVGYRPPTPPMHSEDEEEEEIEVDAEAAQFVTYDELEELGEIIDPVKPEAEEREVQEVQEQVPAQEKVEELVQVHEVKEQVPEPEKVQEPVPEPEEVKEQIDVQTVSEEVQKAEEQEVLPSAAENISELEVPESRVIDTVESIGTADQNQEPAEISQEEQEIQQSQEAEIISAVGTQALAAIEEMLFPTVSAVPSIPVSEENQETEPEILPVEDPKQEQTEVLDPSAEKVVEVSGDIFAPEEIQETVGVAVESLPVQSETPTEIAESEEHTDEPELITCQAEILPVGAEVSEEQIASEATPVVQAEKENVTETQEELVLASETENEQVIESQEVKAIVDIEKVQQETEELPETLQNNVPLELPYETSQEPVASPVDAEVPTSVEQSDVEISVEQTNTPLESIPECTTAAEQSEMVTELEEVGKPIENLDTEFKSQENQEPVEVHVGQDSQDNFVSEPDQKVTDQVEPLAEEISCTQATLGSSDDSSPVEQSPQSALEKSTSTQQIVVDVVAGEGEAHVESEIVPVREEQSIITDSCESEIKLSEVTEQLPEEEPQVETTVLSESQEDTTPVQSSEETTLTPTEESIQEQINYSQTLEEQSPVIEEVPTNDSIERLEESVPVAPAESQTIPSQQDAPVESTTSALEETQSTVELQEPEGSVDELPSMDNINSEAFTTTDSENIDIQEVELEKPELSSLASEITSNLPDVIPTLPASSESSEGIVADVEDQPTSLSDQRATEISAAPDSVSETVEVPEISAAEILSSEALTATSPQAEAITEATHEHQVAETSPEVLNDNITAEPQAQIDDSPQPEPAELENLQESEILAVPVDTTSQESTENITEVQELQITETSAATSSVTEISEPGLLISVELPTCTESASTTEVEPVLQTTEESSGATHLEATQEASSQTAAVTSIGEQVVESEAGQQIPENVKAEVNDESKISEITTEITETQEPVTVCAIPIATDVIETDNTVAHANDSIEQQETPQQADIPSVEVSECRISEDTTREPGLNVSTEALAETSDSVVQQAVESEDSEEPADLATHASNSDAVIPVPQTSDNVEKAQTPQSSEIPVTVVCELKDPEEPAVEPSLDTPTQVTSTTSDSAVAQQAELEESQEIPMDSTIKPDSDSVSIEPSEQSTIPEDTEDQESVSNADPLPSVLDTPLVAEDTENKANISATDPKSDVSLTKMEELSTLVSEEIPEDSSSQSSEQPAASSTNDSAVETPVHVPATPNLDTNVLKELEDIKNTLLNIQQRLTDAGDSLPEPISESEPQPDSDKPQSCDIAPAPRPEPADTLPPTLSPINFSSTEPELQPQPKRERRFSGPFAPVPASVLDDIEAQIMDTAAMMLAQEPSTIEPVSLVQHFAPTQVTSPRHSVDRELEDDPGIEENFVARNVRYYYDKDDADQLAAATFSDSDVIVADLENAIGEINTLPTASACSKGSSPDMDEYEVVKPASLPQETQREGLEKVGLTTETQEKDQEPKVAESLSTSTTGSAESVTSFEFINSPALQSSTEDKET